MVVVLVSIDDKIFLLLLKILLDSVVQDRFENYNNGFIEYVIVNVVKLVYIIVNGYFSG